MDGISTVSYTHLDVYKRQPLNNVYEDSRIYDTFEEMCQDGGFDDKRFARIGRYPDTEKR